MASLKHCIKKLVDAGEVSPAVAAEAERIAKEHVKDGYTRERAEVVAIDDLLRESKNELASVYKQLGIKSNVHNDFPDGFDLFGDGTTTTESMREAVNRGSYALKLLSHKQEMEVYKLLHEGEGKDEQHQEKALDLADEIAESKNDGEWEPAIRLAETIGRKDVAKLLEKFVAGNITEYADKLIARVEELGHRDLADKLGEAVAHAEEHGDWDAVIRAIEETDNALGTLGRELSSDTDSVIRQLEAEKNANSEARRNPLFAQGSDTRLQERMGNAPHRDSGPAANFTPAADPKQVAFLLDEAATRRRVSASAARWICTYKPQALQRGNFLTKPEVTQDETIKASVI